MTGAGVEVGRIPRAIGKYRLLDELGRGASSLVYRARQDGTERSVALKVLRSEAMSGEGLIRFREEAVTLARLPHPGIAQVYEADVADTATGPVAYIAMELVDGAPLADWCAAEHDVRMRLEVFASICDAVHFAHERGIVHRDLKPANVVVTRDGTPKVLDFGIARRRDRDPQAKLTESGRLLGTTAYMSPEQARGEVEIGPRSDVYSLGILLHELLAGELPRTLRDCKIHELAHTSATRPLAMLPGPRGRRWRERNAIIHMATRSRPDRRYPSVAALRDDVIRYLDDRPLIARPPGPRDAARRLARRHGGKLAVALGISAVMLLAAMLARTGWTRAAQWNDWSADMSRVVGVIVDRIATCDSPEALETCLQALERTYGALPRRRTAALQRGELWERIGDACVARGDAQAAWRYRRRVLAQRREAARDPDCSDDVRAQLSIAIVKLGDLEMHTGATRAGLERYREALAVDLELVARTAPRDLRYVDNLVWSWTRLGQHARSAGDLDAAATLIGRGLEWAELAHAREPEVPLRRYTLTHALLDSANVERARRPKSRPPAVAAALQLALELCEEHGRNRDYLRVCLRALRLWTRCGFHVTDREAQLPTYRKAMLFAHELGSVHGAPHVRHEVCQALLRYAWTCARYMDRAREAKGTYRRALLHARTAADAEPETATYGLDVLTCCARLSLLEWQTDRESANRTMRIARQYARGLCPDCLAPRDLLLAAESLVGRRLAAADRDVEGALAFARRAIPHHAMLSERDQRWLSSLCARLKLRDELERAVLESSLPDEPPTPPDLGNQAHSGR